MWSMSSWFYICCDNYKTIKIPSLINIYSFSIQHIKIRSCVPCLYTSRTYLARLKASSTNWALLITGICLKKQKQCPCHFHKKQLTSRCIFRRSPRSGMSLQYVVGNITMHWTTVSYSVIRAQNIQQLVPVALVIVDSVVTHNVEVSHHPFSCCCLHCIVCGYRKQKGWS